MSQSSTISEISRDTGRKMQTLTCPTCTLAPPYVVTALEFCQDLWHHKTRIAVLSCRDCLRDVYLAVLTEHRLVTDSRWTDSQTDRQTDRQTAPQHVT